MSAPSTPTRERVGAVLAVGFAVAVYSHFYDRYQLPPRLPGSFGLIVGGDVLPLLALPALFVRFGLREPLADFGFRWPGWRALALWAGAVFLAVLPFVVVYSQRPEFRAFYPSPQFPLARQHALGLAFLWLLHHAPQLFATEFCFRGFLLLPLARYLGLVRAVVVLTALYVALHAAKPPLELIQALWAGIVFSIAAWRTRSFLPAFFAHWLVAMAMDWLCLQPRWF